MKESEFNPFPPATPRQRYTDAALHELSRLDAGITDEALIGHIEAAIAKIDAPTIRHRGTRRFFSIKIAAAACLAISAVILAISFQAGKEQPGGVDITSKEIYQLELDSPEATLGTPYQGTYPFGPEPGLSGFTFVHFLYPETPSPVAPDSESYDMGPILYVALSTPELDRMSRPPDPGGFHFNIKTTFHGIAVPEDR